MSFLFEKFICLKNSSKILTVINLRRFKVTCCRLWPLIGSFFPKKSRYEIFFFEKKTFSAIFERKSLIGVSDYPQKIDLDVKSDFQYQRTNEGLSLLAKNLFLENDSFCAFAAAHVNVIHFFLFSEMEYSSNVGLWMEKPDPTPSSWRRSWTGPASS